MAEFNDMPNEVLEHIFSFLDLNTRCNLALVCQRWNAVLLSDRFLNRNVVLHLNGRRLLTKQPIRRNYRNFSISLEPSLLTPECIKSVRMIPSVVPSPTHVELHYAALNDVNFMAIYTEQLIDFRTVETLFLFGTMSKYLVKLPITPKEHRVQFVTDRLHTLNLNLPALQSLRIGSKKGARLEGIECLMAFTRLRTLTLVNVKLYPEVQQLTPTYSVERMVLAHYDKLEDNHLLVLVKRFPALRWLHIKRCHGIDQREIDKLKRMHPKLAVAYDVPSPVALWNDGVEDRKSHEVDYTFKPRK